MRFDDQTRNLKRSCLRLRDGLRFAPQNNQGEVFYHIEDTSGGKFYRIAYPQYVFLSLLDGATTFSAALAIVAQTLGSSAISEERGVQFAEWLLQNGLVTFSGASESSKVRKGTTRGLWWRKLNPFWIRIPFGSPDQFFAAVLPFCKSLFHPAIWLTAAATIFVGVFTLAENWDRFAGESRSIFAPTNWLWMIGVWIGLKAIHEFAHGIVCKRLGGQVRETGLILILFAPMAYVDVTASWRFPSKWQRIAVASAGMHVELFVASVAVIWWSRTQSALTAQLLYNVILMAGFSTVLFNANPLMRFDGYFILSDLLEIPNLYEVGARQVHACTRRFFFGERSRACETSRDTAAGWLLTAYGFAAAAWKVVVCVTLLVTAAAMFKGAGIVIAAFGAALWFGKPMLNIAQTITQKYLESRTAFLRAVTLATALTLVCAAMWIYAPAPATLSVPCTVDYQDAAIVRATSDGFVREVLVAGGKFVKSGTPLIRLENEELNVEIARLQSEMNKAQQRILAARNEHNQSEVQIELARQRSVLRELGDKQHQASQLTIVASRDGTVVARNLDKLLGAYVKQGEELLVISNSSDKELIVSISHADVQDAFPRVGEDVHIRLGSRRRIQGKLKRIDPRASKTLTHESLAATVGGPIPVQAVDGTDRSGNSLEFHAPRFSGVVAIGGLDAEQIYCGERGFVQLGSRETTFATWIYRNAKSIVEARSR
ncbi:MAG: efflux RND transporter periplasmic adaptor subunit [Planctomycetales bacterium]|nr:efflux RND transporter periplasmic adaptor subunit [Planctomycetales bacterium]